MLIPDDDNVHKSGTRSMAMTGLCHQLWVWRVESVSSILATCVLRTGKCYFQEEVEIFSPESETDCEEEH